MRKALKTSNESIKIERKIVPVLGVGVDSTSRDRVLVQVQEVLSKKRSKGKSRQASCNPFFIITPNPEIVMYAQHDKQYKEVLNKASLSIPDGIGVVAAQRLLSKKLNSKGFSRVLQTTLQGLRVGAEIIFGANNKYQTTSSVPGRLVFEDLIKLAAENGWKIYLVGAGQGIAAATAQKLISRNSSLNIEFSVGPWVGRTGEPENDLEKAVEKTVIAKINKFKPDILFVAFGHPKQERWLYRNLTKLDTKVAMVVGGTFDYVSGRVAAPPTFVTTAGFEWLWRLVTQPSRFKRIMTAVILFPIAVYMEKVREGGGGK